MNVLYEGKLQPHTKSYDNNISRSVDEMEKGRNKKPYKIRPGVVI